MPHLSCASDDSLSSTWSLNQFSSMDSMDGLSGQSSRHESVYDHEGERESTRHRNLAGEKKQKRKFRCLKLDVKYHYRNIFFTTFYRIYMYRRKSLMLTLLQLLVPPLILVGMTAYLGSLLKVEKVGWSSFESLTETDLYDHISSSKDSQSVMTLFFQDESNKPLFVKSFTEELRKRLQSKNIRLEPIQDEKDLIRKAVHQHLLGEPATFIGGIEILNPGGDNPDDTVNGIGDNFTLSFTIVMAHHVPGFDFKNRPTFFDLNKNLPSNYYQLLGIELAICRTFYSLVNKTTPIHPEKQIFIEVQSMSYPPHVSYTLKEPENLTTVDEERHKEHRREELDSMLSTILVLSMVPVFFTVVEGPVQEKETGFKLYLQLMGYPRGAYWFSWILNQMIIQFLVVIIQISLIFLPLNLNTGKLVREGDWRLWFIILWLYNLCCLSYFTFLGAYFRRAKMATFIGILIWLLSFHIFQSHMPAFDFGSGFGSFILTCLIPSGCIHWAVFILTTINTKNSWDVSVFYALTEISGFKLVNVIAMMILDFFLYFLLTLYVDNLYPGPLEYSQPWHYFFESIRCRFQDSKDSSTRRRAEDTTSLGSSTGEVNPKRVIEFQRISKKFHLIEGVFGIEDVKFSVFSNSITALLGHKDSGKTTLMRLVCGEYSPSSGTVLVNGYNVRKDTQKVQSFLSLCPEKDLLCEYLTVMEHMQLIGKLKGLKLNQIQKKAKGILESVGLLSQSNDDIWRLVKWQRRVLCVAMALLGETQILLLDEPTRDLEIDVKRQIWSLLDNLKHEGKVILMSTDDIREANQIADRIVIMSRGKVAGVGKPSRLESIFETGYHLGLETLPDIKNEDEIIKFLKARIPSITELEGNYIMVQKVLQHRDWDNSQACLMSLKDREEKAEPITKRKSMDKESIAKKKLLARLGDAETKSSESRPTIVQMSRLSQKLDKFGLFDMSRNTEHCFLLPKSEKANFPKLFKDLDEPGTAVKLGLRRYELIYHDLDKAFSELDDYVDVLDASANLNEEELDFDDLEGKKALKLLKKKTQFNEHERGHADRAGILLEGRKREGCYRCFSSFWAIVLKRVFYAIGNYQHVIVQILAPILLTVIVIKSTNVYFKQRILQPEVSLTASTELSAPIVVPYRMEEDNPSSSAKDLFAAFEKTLRMPPNKIKKTENIGNKSFEEVYNEQTLRRLDEEVIIAADFTEVKNDSRTVKALFSPYRYHSAPLSLLLMFNAILDAEFPEKTLKVAMSGKRLEHDTQWLFLLNSTFPRKISDNNVDITLTVALAFGYFIFTSGFVVQPCAERKCSLKRYQMYTLKWNGLYWIAMGLVDLIFNVFVVLVLTLTVIYTPVHGVFRNIDFIILFVLTTTLGGFASIITSYIWSHFLLQAETSYYSTLSMNQVFGLFTFLLYSIINFDYIGFHSAYIASICLQIIQPFTIPWNFYTALNWTLHTNSVRCSILDKIVKEEMCSEKADDYPRIKHFRRNCCGETVSFQGMSFIFGDRILSTNVTILITHCLAGILLLMYMESRRMRRKLFSILQNSVSTPPALKDEKDEETLQKEDERIEAIKKLDPKERKKYFLVEKLGTSTFSRTILFPLSFVAEPGRCTAIVGPATSGLTVLYQILSGLRAVSEGNVTYGGYSLLSFRTRRQFFHHLGLCPVRDVAIDKLTGIHLLKLFGRLRGIPLNHLNEHVDFWARSLDLHKKIKKRCLSYSIVTRKKLAVALAAIGNPPVIIFDEPMKDLDPVSRAQVAKVLEMLTRANCVVIIMTHDVAEVQNICDKLIVLVNGQVQFCRETEEMRRELDDEFCILIKFKEEIDFNAFVEFKKQFEQQLENMTLQAEDLHSLTYRVKSEKYHWNNLFEVMEEISTKFENLILDYYIRKASLEDAYYAYTLKQRILRADPSAWDEFMTTYC